MEIGQVKFMWIQFFSGYALIQIPVTISTVYAYLKRRLYNEVIQNHVKNSGKSHLRNENMAHGSFKCSIESKTNGRCPNSTHQKRELQRIRDQIRDILSEIEVRRNNTLDERLDRMEKRFLSTEG